MTTLSFPAQVPNETLFRIESTATRFVNPFTGGVKVSDFGAQFIVIDVIMRSLRGANKREVEAFLAELVSGQHRFTMTDRGANNAGSYGGTPLINGADQAGPSATIDGASTGVSTWAAAGDRVGIGGHIKLITADASSDGSGNVSLSFRPALHSSPADNSAVVTSNPTSTFLLLADSVNWTNRHGPNGPESDCQFTAVEDVEA